MAAAEVKRAARHDSQPGTLDRVTRLAMQQGYSVPNQARHGRQTARITRRALSREGSSAQVAPPPSGPVSSSLVPGKSWRGITGGSAPPDETSAIGTERYVELANGNFAIYPRTSNTPVAQGSLADLAGAPADDFIGDQQIIWDPTTSRFYYAMGDWTDPTHNYLEFGWSRTATPDDATQDWCHYSIDYGPFVTDFPKLGDSKDFVIIGIDLSGPNGSSRHELSAVSKPTGSGSCPETDTLKFAHQNFHGGSIPVPANEIDTDPTGWAIGAASSMSALRLFRITPTADGTPSISKPTTTVPVEDYSWPANAPQKGSMNLISTGGPGPVQAVAAIDPRRGGKLAIWTQHTVSGGAGAEVRWYEIDPAGARVLQSGTVSSQSSFVFNGAISPNRRANGSTAKGGGSMVMNFNSSSSASFPAIWMVSKVGRSARSGWELVKHSPGPVSGWDCSQIDAFGGCRWGDYAAATPDPVANRVWQVSQFAVGSGSDTTGDVTSRTWNFVATP